MKIDERTGLPELPEGYFWRVDDDLIIYLELRRRTWWGGSVRVLGEGAAGPKGRPFYLSWMEDEEDISEALVKTARSILRDHQSNQARQDLKNRFIGDYPPKTLNTIEEESN